MSFALAVNYGLFLAVLTTLLRNIVTAEAEYTANLANVPSTLITEPHSKVSPSFSTKPEDLLNTKLVEITRTTSSSKQLANIETDSKISQEIMMNSTPLLIATKPTPEVDETMKEISTQISSNVEKALSPVDHVASNPQIVAVTSTILRKVSTTTVRQEASAIPMPDKKGNTNDTIAPQTHSAPMQAKSFLIQPDQRTVILEESRMNLTATKTQPKILTSMASFGLAEQSSLPPTVHGKINVTDGENIKREPITVFMHESKMTSLTLQLLPNFGKTQIMNSTVASRSYDLLPESTVISKDDASNIFSRANMSYTSIEAGAIYSKIVSRKPYFDVNASTRISLIERQANRTAFLHPSPSLVTRQNQSNINVVFTKSAPNMTEVTHSVVSKGSALASGSDLKVQHSISKRSFLLTYNHTMQSNATKKKWPNKTVSKSAMLHINTSKVMQTKQKINNQTKCLKRLTTIQPSSSLSLPSKVVIDTTKEILQPSSITVDTKTNISKFESSYPEIKPTSTSLFTNSRSQYTIPTRPTLATKLKEQQFACTIKITSETFKDEYIKSVRALRQKISEIEEQFDHVFKNMPEYLYTEVLRLFKGSLGCDVVIHTESIESQLVSVEKINNLLHQAKNTKGGFGKFEVGDIDVKEKDPDVQSRNEEDEKKGWKRLPIIIISVLGGVCLVLLVVVISQCIQKRHYSHSLAESNEIREYSPDIQLKYNDDSVYKDDERVPMTTFNQTDIY